LVIKIAFNRLGDAGDIIAVRSAGPSSPSPPGAYMINDIRRFEKGHLHITWLQPGNMQVTSVF
jgi:hypothetical protein